MPRPRAPARPGVRGAEGARGGREEDGEAGDEHGARRHRHEFLGRPQLKKRENPQKEEAPEHGGKVLPPVSAHLGDVEGSAYSARKSRA